MNKGQIDIWATGKTLKELEEFKRYLSNVVIPSKEKRAQIEMLEREQEYNDKNPVIGYTVVTGRWYHDVARGAFDRKEGAEDWLKRSGLEDKIHSNIEFTVRHTILGVRDKELWGRLNLGEVSHPALPKPFFIDRNFK